MALHPKLAHVVVPAAIDPAGVRIGQIGTTSLKAPHIGTTTCASFGCSHGNPFRVFYALDPQRTAILLIGGDKTGNDRFYEEMIQVADAIYDQHIDALTAEGLIRK